MIHEIPMFVWQVQCPTKLCDRKFESPLITSQNSGVGWPSASGTGFQDGSWLSTLIGELILHASFASESLEALEESDSDKDEAVLYNPNDARCLYYMFRNDRSRADIF